MRVHIHSDILIRHLRGERRAAALLRRLSAESGTEPWTGALRRAEVVCFMRPAETPATMSFLSRFKTEPVTQEIADDAADLYRRWHPAHRTDVNDAILAATVIATGGKIYTQNVTRDPMPDIPLARGW